MKRSTEWGLDICYLSTTSLEVLVGCLCSLTESPSSFPGVPQHKLSVPKFWYHFFLILSGLGKLTSSLSPAHIYIKSPFASSNDPPRLGHLFPVGFLTGVPNEPIFSLAPSLNDWFTLKISALCNTHSKTFSGTAEFPDRGWGASFLCSPLRAYLQNFLFHLKKHITMTKRTSVLCMKEQHNNQLTLHWALPPNLVTQHLSLEMALLPLRSVFSYLQAFPWQHPAHPSRENSVIRAAGSPSNPAPPLPPGLTTNWRRPKLNAFVWPLENFFFFNFSYIEV